MKTTHKGEVNFHVVSLEEPDEANAEGLKAALRNFYNETWHKYREKE